MNSAVGSSRRMVSQVFLKAPSWTSAQATLIVMGFGSNFDKVSSGLLKENGLQRE